FKGTLTGKGYEAASVFFSGLSPLERKLAFFVNGSVIASPLFQSYFSMVPSRLGKFGEARAVKYAWFPESCTADTSAFDAETRVQYPEWARRRDFATPSRTGWALKAIPPHKKDTPHDYLRQATEGRLRKGEFCFALNVQLYRDQFSTNIEDSTDIWLGSAQDRDHWLKQIKQDKNLDHSYEDKIRKKKFSPYLKVASLKIGQLLEGEKAENSKTCEDLSFNPWNGRTDMHKPLGVVSRMKRRVYGASRRTRHGINGIDSKSLE
ncbi:MAG: hypothetical protein K2X47_00260, partial [Bdellovibrionales bacterium]|nr:hypothetical protein [Bdellovibrionales bacterium]